MHPINTRHPYVAAGAEHQGDNGEQRRPDPCSLGASSLAGNIDKLLASLELVVQSRKQRLLKVSQLI